MRLQQRVIVGIAHCLVVTVDRTWRFHIKSKSVIVFANIRFFLIVATIMLKSVGEILYLDTLIKITLNRFAL